MLVLRARQPETKPRSCGNQSAHESMFNRRLRVLSPAVRSSEPALPATAETNNCVRTLEREHEKQAVEQPHVRAKRFQRTLRHQIQLAKLSLKRDKVETQRQHNHLGALLNRPIKREYQRVAGSALRSDCLGDQRPVDAGGNADARSVDGTPKHRAGKMRTMPVPVAVTLPEKSRLIMVKPVKAGCAASIPVSSTATTTPLPVNGDLSAPTAVTPQAMPGVSAGIPSSVSGAMSFIGMTGAMASTAGSRATAWTSVLSR